MTTLGAFETNRVYCCDALELLRGLPDGSVDLVVTSPPYDNLRTYNGYSFDFEPIAHESYRVLKQGGVQVWVVGDAFVNSSLTLTSFRQALYFVDVAGFNMHQRVAWEQEGMPTKRPQAYQDDFEDNFVLSKGTPKTFNPILKRNRNAGQRKRRGNSGKQGFVFSQGERTVNEHSVLTNVWTVGVGYMIAGKDRLAYEHPAPFPEVLAERYILTWSNAGDLVVDYFGGSGTTAKMARNNGRNFLTCDISLEYCELIRKRLAMPYTLPMFAEAMP